MNISESLYKDYQRILDSLDTPLYLQDLIRKSQIPNSRICKQLPSMCKYGFISRTYAENFPRRYVYTRNITVLPSIVHIGKEPEYESPPILSNSKARVISFSTVEMQNKLKQQSQQLHKERAKLRTHIGSTFNMV